MRMSEASSTDESARRDRITDAQISQAKRTLWITPTLLLIFGSASLFSFAVLNNTAAGITFLTIPVLRFLGTFVSAYAIRRQSKADE